MKTLIVALALMTAGPVWAGVPTISPAKRAVFAACQSKTEPLLSRIDALRARVPEDGEQAYTAKQRAHLATGAELKRVSAELDTLRAQYDRAFKDCEKAQWQSKNPSTALVTSP